jgi:hypothetical protein
MWMKTIGLVVGALVLVSLVERLRRLTSAGSTAVQRYGRPWHYALLWRKGGN